jgi:dienelactone hydrolase
MWFRQLTLFVCVITGICRFAFAGNYEIAFNVKPGPHAVGLRVVEQYDRQRSFGVVSAGSAPGSEAAGFRPLQTLVWYPAQQSKRPAMTMGDYLALMATEVSFGRPQQTRDGDVLKAWLQSTLRQSLSAVRDAEPEDGQYPVVIYAPSFSSTSWENADLCEYLASYGFVVIASPGMGKDSSDSTHDLTGINAQASDVSFLIGYAATLRDTEMTKVAAMGFSWGGLSNLFAASADPRIKALVSLDGSERYFPGLVQASGAVHPDQMHIPFLYFGEVDQSLEDQDRLDQRFHAQGPSVLNQWTHGDLITVRMLGLFHPEFCSIAYRNSELWEQELPNLQIADYDRADGVEGYAWVMRYIKAFLDFYLKQNAEAGSFLKRSPGMNGVPKHTMSIKFTKAAPFITKAP